MRYHGIDISHHNSPDWDLVSQTSQFAICRATYGTAKDRKVDRHVRDAQNHGMKFGLYHFFRASRSVNDQLQAFIDVANSVGYGLGDIWPCLDLEDDVKDHLDPTWNERAKKLYDGLVKVFGGCIVYITQRDWKRLGEPSWVLLSSLWVAHWNVTRPAAPGGAAWVMWQYKVGPYRQQHEPFARGALDHDWATELLRIGLPGQAPTLPPVDPRGPVVKVDWDAHYRDRHKQVMSLDSDDD